MFLISSLSLGRMLKKLCSNISGGFWLNPMTHFLDHLIGTSPLKNILRCQTTKRTTVSEFPATKTQDISKKHPQNPSTLGFRAQQQTSWASPIKERANMLVKPRSWISAAPREGVKTVKPKRPPKLHRRWMYIYIYMWMMFQPDFHRGKHMFSFFFQVREGFMGHISHQGRPHLRHRYTQIKAHFAKIRRDTKLEWTKWNLGFRFNWLICSYCSFWDQGTFPVLVPIQYGYGDMVGYIPEFPKNMCYSERKLPCNNHHQEFWWFLRLGDPNLKGVARTPHRKFANEPAI